jgi:hypothetical protein
MSAKCQFRKSTRSLEEDVPDRDARIAEVPKPLSELAGRSFLKPHRAGER